jgi:FkbM family methyltransferase
MKQYLKALASYWPTAKALSIGNLEAVVLFISLLSIPVRKRLFGRAPRPIRITVAGMPHRFYARDGSDISVLREMFTDREYAFPEAKSYTPTHIADLGAHVGAATLFLRAHYPNVKVTAYEPDPENFALLQKNVGSLPRVTCVNAAVAPIHGHVTLYTHAGGSTRGTLSRDPDTTGEIEVPAVTFEEVVALGVDGVKFDGEGAEYDLFAAAPESVRTAVPLYLGEFHETLTRKSPEEFTALFPGYACAWTSGALVVMTRTL